MIGSDRETEALIALTLIPGLGPARIRALIRDFGSARAVFRADAARLTRVRGVGAAIASDVRRLDRVSQVRRQLERARRAGARCIFSGRSGYPPLLEHTYDPPPLLWTRGRSDVDLTHTLAVVGTRRPTHGGRRLAYDIAFALAERGWTVVSGLAYGIDAAAHRGALDAGGNTAAVMGSGADVVYPGAHRKLFERITRRGVILSEFPMGAKPDAMNFPRRNRVISGMCRGVVLVEAFEKGGGLITARFALDQNREVFAVPGFPDSEASLGCNRLIQSGEAKLIVSVDDIEVELGFARPPSTRSPRPSDVTDGVSDDPVLAALSREPEHIDAICGKTGLGPAEVQARLLLLEISGLVCQIPGKRFYLNT